MSTSELISKAAEYTERFVNAAIPVAKKAYEVGLLTIQIDALSVLIPAFAVIILIVVFFRKVLLPVKKNCEIQMLAYNEAHPKWTPKTDWTDFHPNYEQFTWGLVNFLCAIPALISLVPIINIWIWIKLFHPDLWLAKQAIEKVLEVAK